MLLRNIDSAFSQLYSKKETQYLAGSDFIPNNNNAFFEVYGLYPFSSPILRYISSAHFPLINLVFSSNVKTILG